MNRDPVAWVSPIVALIVLAAAAAQTLGALRVTGAFGWQSAVPRVAVSPVYGALERALDRHDPRFALAGMRDPFMYGPLPVVAVAPVLPTHPRPAPVVRRELPVVTAIVWDNDPRALVRWRAWEWTVRVGGLFDEFQVVGITRDQVTLKHGDSTLVLSRRNPGE